MTVEGETCNKKQGLVEKKNQNRPRKIKMCHSKPHERDNQQKPVKGKGERERRTTWRIEQLQWVTVQQ